MAHDRTTRILALKCGGEAAPVGDIAAPGDIGGCGTPIAAAVGTTGILNVVRLCILLNPKAVMDNVAVNDSAFGPLDVNAVVRPAIAFIALDQGFIQITIDLDTVMAEAIANFVVQELRTAGTGNRLPVEILKLVVVTRIPVTTIVNVRILDGNTK